MIEQVVPRKKKKNNNNKAKTKTIGLCHWKILIVEELETIYISAVLLF